MKNGTSKNSYIIYFLTPLMQIGRKEPVKKQLRGSHIGPFERNVVKDPCLNMYIALRKTVSEEIKERR